MKIIHYNNTLEVGVFYIAPFHSIPQGSVEGGMELGSWNGNYVTNGKSCFRQPYV